MSAPSARKALKAKGSLASEKKRPRANRRDRKGAKETGPKHQRSFHALLSETAERCGTALAVGGQALDAEVRGRLRHSIYCERLRDLVGFARTLRPQARVES